MNIPQWIPFAKAGGKTVLSLNWGGGTGLIVWTDGTYSYTEQLYDSVEERALDYMNSYDRALMRNAGLITEDEFRNYKEIKKKMVEKQQRDRDLKLLAKLKAKYEGQEAKP